MNIQSPVNISIHAKTPGIEDFPAELVVTLPTFKRPEHLLATLDSLRSQITSRRFAIIVMDNDAQGHEGADAAGKLFSRGELNGYLIVAHDRGNCNAYNAGWHTAMQRFPSFQRLLVIDDDELAGRNWLEAHCRTAKNYSADIVGGPQVPVFETPELQHWEGHPVFQPAHQKTGLVDVLYSSGNLSLSRQVLETMAFPYLDLRFNFLGGGDSDFLSRCVQAGFQLAWSAEAIVRETQPARRTEADWIRARAIRNGVISTLVEQRKRSSEAAGQFRTFAKSVALAGLSPLRTAMALGSGKPWNTAVYPMLVGAGRMMGHFGVEAEQYRNAEKN